MEGDVNDPTFRIGGVIMKALANLITSIVTARSGCSVDWSAAAIWRLRPDLLHGRSRRSGAAGAEKVAKIADALVMRRISR